MNQKSWVGVDAKAAAAGASGRSLTFAVSGSSSSTLYVNSGEAANYQPQLVVVYTPAPPPPPPTAMGVGINLAAPADWGTEVPFLDLMKLSDGWHTQCDKWSGADPECTMETSDWDTYEQALLDLDSNGWPKSLPSPAVPDGKKYTRVATLVPAGLSPEHPTGRLIVKYPGTGEVQYRFDQCSGTVTRGFDPADPTLHRDVLDLQAHVGAETSSKIHVLITATDALDPIRHVRVTPHGGLCSNDATQQCDPDQKPSGTCSPAACQRFEDVVEGQPFHPRFLANIKPFTQIRSMEFQNTNESLLSDWANRTLPAHRRWTAHGNSDGVPIETIVQLANTLGADLWLNIPSRATDELVRQMATLVKSQLEADRKLVVEYSNEAWNTAFGTNGNWIEAQGVATWPTAADHPFLKRINWYAKRSGEICGTWKAAWGAAESNRVSCAAGGQSASPDFTRIMLDCPLQAQVQGHGCYQDFDSLAIAPYFGYYLGSPENAPIVAGWSADLNLLFSELTVGTGLLAGAPPQGALNAAVDELTMQISIARDRGLELLGYEAGQHLVGFGSAVDNPTLTARLTAANRDPRMGQLYLSYLREWQQSGAGPVMLFNSAGAYGKWGSWGLLEYRDQDPSTSPKYKAVVQDFLGQPLS